MIVGVAWSAERGRPIEEEAPAVGSRPAAAASSSPPTTLFPLQHTQTRAPLSQTINSPILELSPAPSRRSHLCSPSSSAIESRPSSTHRAARGRSTTTQNMRNAAPPPIRPMLPTLARARVPGTLLVAAQAQAAPAGGRGGRGGRGGGGRSGGGGGGRGGGGIGSRSRSSKRRGRTSKGGGREAMMIGF